MAAGALFPSVLGLYDIPEPSIWKASALLFGLPMLALLVSFPCRRIIATGKAAPPLILAAFVGIGSLSIAAMIASVFGNFGHPMAAYATALTVNFLTHAFAFVIALDVILGQGKNRNRIKLRAAIAARLGAIVHHLAKPFALLLECKWQH